MSANFDYGLQYREFHSDNDEYFESRVVLEAARLQPFIPKNTSHALDIGCGIGFMVGAMQRLGVEQVVGVDVDRSQIEAACRRGFNAEQISSICEYLDATSRRIDFITMMDVLEHVPKDQQVRTMQSIYKALVPGGRLLIQVPNANSVAASRWLYNDFTHVCSYTEASLRPVLISGGFERVEIAANNTAQRPSFRPSRMFSKGNMDQARRWLVRRLWRQVLIAELGESARALPLELNLLVIAEKSL